VKRRGVFLMRPLLAFAALAALVVGGFAAPAPQAQASVAPVLHAAAGTNHDPITGGGSTWAENAVDQWVRNVWANYQWKVNYSGTGSTQGRSQYCQGTYDFGVTDIPYGLPNSNEVDSCPNRPYVYMPVVAGGTAIMYNLQVGGQRVTNLRLSGDTFAKIFTGVITKWDDPAIQADNPQIALPSIPVVPVVRSDGSGATAQVTIWMRQMHPQIWDAYCAKVGRPSINGHCGATSLYPMLPSSNMISRAGDNSVAAYTAQPGNVGAITYVEYSYALNTGFPVAKLLNEAGYYTEPTAGHVAVSLLQAKLDDNPNSPTYLIEDLSSVYTDQDPRAYELSSYSYLVLPTSFQGNFDANKGLTLADYSAYLLCEGQQQVNQLGYSALPINLVQAGQQQIQKIPGGDPRIKGIQQCNNPTFSADGTNKLASNDPKPAACDQKGPVQCSSGTGGNKAATAPTRNQGAKAPKPGAGSGGAANGGGAAGAGAAGGAAGDAGDAAAGSGGDGSGAQAPAGYVGQTADVVLASANPQKLPGFRSPWMPLIVFGAAAVMLALAVLPAVIRRRKKQLPTWLVQGPKR
jgi:phosphate ABC transporter phosphate-binding protein